MNMKFVKGMIMGSVIVAGSMMIYNEMSCSTRKKFIKKGKQIAKKIGIV